MRSALQLLLIATSVGTIGYLELRHRDERETWQVEVARLNDRLEQAENLADEHAEAVSDLDYHHQEQTRAKGELADLEIRILEAAAKLAQLESDRAITQERADQATLDLKKQIGAFAAIEIDLAAVNQKREGLAREADGLEQRLQHSEMAVAERQKHVEKLDREIVRLAIRREVLVNDFDATEKAMVETLPDPAATQSATVAALPSEDEPAAPTAPPAAAEAIDDEPPAEDRDRTRGLYQFGSLSATPDLSKGGMLDETPPLSEGSVADDEASQAEDWADKQYLLGLKLLSSAEQNSGTRELSDAVLAFKAVLGEWPKERNRMRWAIARSDLGYALALLGKRQKNPGVLEQAVATSREALGEFHQDETPLLWAAAQHHLGVSLDGLADIRDDQSLRQASIEALEQAIATFKDEGAEANAKKAAKRLREAYAELPLAKE